MEGGDSWHICVLLGLLDKSLQRTLGLGIVLRGLARTAASMR